MSQSVYPLTVERGCTHAHTAEARAKHAALSASQVRPTCAPATPQQTGDKARPHSALLSAVAYSLPPLPPATTTTTTTTTPPFTVSLVVCPCSRHSLAFPSPRLPWRCWSALCPPCAAPCCSILTTTTTLALPSHPVCACLPSRKLAPCAPEAATLPSSLPLTRQHHHGDRRSTRYAHPSPSPCA